MSYQATVVEILLAGPGDVGDERKMIAEEIDSWNQHHVHQMGIMMKAVAWETDTYPELGADAQTIINKQIAGRCAAVIAVFATRLGTPTPRAPSGTAEEIDRFGAEGKPVAVYFSEGMGDLSRLDSVQFQALRDYKDSLKNRGLYGGYESADHLRQQIAKLLSAWGYHFQTLKQADEPQQVGARTTFDPTQTDMGVIAAVGRLNLEMGTSYVNSLYLHEAPELLGVLQEDIFESLRVLRGRNLINGSNIGRWEVSLSSDGLEMWLLNFTRDYDEVQRNIASALVIENIRDPALISTETGVPRIIVEHVLERWADRDLVIINKLYDSTRIDRYSKEILQLAQRDIDRERTRSTAVREDNNTMNPIPRYRTISSAIGIDTIALSDFGGELGDQVAAAVKVDGWTVVQVVAPSERSAWDAQREERFRFVVRQLAASHGLLERQGKVRLVFDPPQSSTEKRDETAGELVERK